MEFVKKEWRLSEVTLAPPSDEQRAMPRKWQKLVINSQIGIITRKRKI
jgi:hypothetical protein